MTKAERDPHLVFRVKVSDAALAEEGIGIPEYELRPQMAVMRLVNTFMDEKLRGALNEGDPLRAFQELGALRVVLGDMVAMGRKEFKSMLAIADDALDGAVKMMKDHLLKKYLDAPEERAAELHEALLDLAAGGYWDSLREDLDDELWRREMDKPGRAKAPEPWAC